MRSKFVLFSKVVQAQLAIIGGAVAVMVDAIVSRGAEDPFPTLVVGNSIATIVVAGVAIVGRFVAQGPLTMGKGAAVTDEEPMP